ncbi:MAG: superoxide dismutase family protein [Rhizobiaceae bacterium]|nr:superoxide dismutase family protein [Rhizobiaceae bacterium]
MRRTIITAAALLSLMLPALAQETATAAMKAPDGSDLGTVTFTATKSGILLVFVEMTGLKPGAHGFHIHAVGKCEGPEFESAGGHIAGGKPHGVMAEGGPHPGDFPNVHVGQDGLLKVEFFTDRLTLDESGDGALMDADGSAVMLHDGPDDYVTDPSGHSGGRIACGIIQQPG